MGDVRIPDAVIRRLPKYYRYLTELAEQGEDRISSAKMSEVLALNASQIRRDLNYFGGFGQQGYGYQVDKLKGELERILGVDKKYYAIVVGAGNIGQALANYTNFKREGVDILALFDAADDVVGSQAAGLTVRHVSGLEAFLADNVVDIGIVAVPKEYARDVAKKLVAGGVRGIWNFAPMDLDVEGAVVENVHLSDSLNILRFYISAREQGQ